MPRGVAKVLAIGPCYGLWDQGRLGSALEVQELKHQNISNSSRLYLYFASKPSKNIFFGGVQEDKPDDRCVLCNAVFLFSSLEIPSEAISAAARISAEILNFQAGS